MKDRDTYQGEMEAKLRELGAKLDEMKAKADKAGAGVRAEMENQIDVLNAKRLEVQKRLDDLKASSADAWTSLRGGAQHAWEDLSKAVEEAIAKFK